MAAKKSYRTNWTIIGLGGKDKVTKAGEIVELTEEQARSLEDAVSVVETAPKPAAEEKPEK